MLKDKDKDKDKWGVKLNATLVFRAFRYSSITISSVNILCDLKVKVRWNWMIFKRYMKENKTGRETGRLEVN